MGTSNGWLLWRRSSDQLYRLFGTRTGRRKFNVNGNTKIKVSSGFVDEGNNEAFKQLLLSERVWFYINSEFIPVNVASTSLEYKTKLNDKLINYEIDFDYAYNEINNVWYIHRK